MQAFLVRDPSKWAFKVLGSQQKSLWPTQIVGENQHPACATSCHTGRLLSLAAFLGHGGYALGRPFTATFNNPSAQIFGCGSKLCTQDGTLASGSMDQNLRSAGCLILTHTHLQLSSHGSNRPFCDHCRKYGREDAKWVSETLSVVRVDKPGPFLVASPVPQKLIRNPPKNGGPSIPQPPGQGRLFGDLMLLAGLGEQGLNRNYTFLLPPITRPFWEEKKQQDSAAEKTLAGKIGACIPSQFSLRQFRPEKDPPGCPVAPFGLTIFGELAAPEQVLSGPCCLRALDGTGFRLRLVFLARDTGHCNLFTCRLPLAAKSESVWCLTEPSGNC